MCRISPINASVIWAKFVPCGTSEGSVSIYRKHSSLALETAALQPNPLEAAGASDG